MSAEWDARVAESAEGRAVSLIRTLEAEVNRLRDRVVALELEVLARDTVIDAVTAERDQAIDRCVARVVADGTPGPGVTLHGYASDELAQAREQGYDEGVSNGKGMANVRLWLPAPGETTFDDDLQGLA